MKAELDCIPCILRQTVDTAKIATDDPQRQEQAIRAVLEKLNRINLELSPPIIGKDIYQIIHGVTGNPDPYKAIKSESNKKAMSIYPAMKKQIEKESTPILYAAKLAAAGNIIDFGVSNRSFDIENIQNEVGTLDFTIDHSDQFLNDIRQAGKVLYLADNAGEIVFDRLFIETLLKYSGNEKLDITVAVRGFPVINDATLFDAEEIGLTDLVKVISNGDSAPGTDLQNTSAALDSEFEAADLIISKGMGNFETLDTVSKNVYHLLKAKCKFTAGTLGVNLGSLVFVNRYIRNTA